MTTQHTPGPWLLDTDHGYARVVFGPCKKLVAHVPHSESADADADLIAAAPDLLAACKACVWHYDIQKQPLSEIKPGIKDMRAAIVKATGPVDDEPDRAGRPDMDSAGGDGGLDRAYGEKRG